MTGDDRGQGALGGPPDGAEAIRAGDGAVAGWVAPAALPDRWRVWGADGRFISAGLPRDTSERMLLQLADESD